MGKSELQGAFYRAADYTDEWFAAESGHAFRAYYICMAALGYGGECGAANRSDVWERAHLDVLAPKQRWYCTECTARYRPKWGVPLEIISPGRSMY